MWVVIRSQVCTGNKADCACLSWRQTGKKGPFYCEIPADGGPPGPILNTTGHQGRQDVWQGVPVSVVSDRSVSVDLSAVNTTAGPVVAVKFGWGFNNMDCCTNPDVAAGLAPCIPGSCGIVTRKSLLPANPFFAVLTPQGKCKCPLPQICDE